MKVFDFKVNTFLMEHQVRIGFESLVTVITGWNFTRLEFDWRFFVSIFNVALQKLVERKTYVTLLALEIFHLEMNTFSVTLQSSIRWEGFLTKFARRSFVKLTDMFSKILAIFEAFFAKSARKFVALRMIFQFVTNQGCLTSKIIFETQFTFEYVTLFDVVSELQFRRKHFSTRFTFVMEFPFVVFQFYWAT